MQRKLKLGILGCAGIAKKSMIDNFLDTGRFEVTAIASRSLEKAKAYCNLFGGRPVMGYAQLLKIDDIDCIYNPLPTGMHYEWSMKCIEAGKHMFVEKSFCNNLKEASEVIEAAKARGLITFENFMFRKNDQYTFIKNELNKGTLGELKMFRSSFGFPIFNPETNIRYKPSLGGGALLDAGAYVLQGAQLLIGHEQRVVSSILQSSDIYNVDFHGYVTLKSDQGVVSQLAFGFENFYQNNIEIWGSEGKLFVNRAYTSPANFYHNVEIIGSNNEVQTFEFHSINPGVSLCMDFANAIDNSEGNEQYNQIINQARLLSDVAALANQ